VDPSGSICRKGLSGGEPVKLTDEEKKQLNQLFGILTTTLTGRHLIKELIKITLGFWFEYWGIISDIKLRY
jgi:uncharacterized protein YajQ (UPF0234 family)